MKKMLLASVVAVIALGAQAENLVPTHATNNEIDRKQEVAYTCTVQIGGKEQKQDITAMYGIKGDDVIVAQLKIDGTITPGMWRDDFMLMNRFISNNVTQKTVVWTTMPTKADKLATTDGGKFAVEQNTGGQFAIILDNCKVKK